MDNQENNIEEILKELIKEESPKENERHAIPRDTTCQDSSCHKKEKQSAADRR